MVLLNNFGSITDSGVHALNKVVLLSILEDNEKTTQKTLGPKKRNPQPIGSENEMIDGTSF